MNDVTETFLAQSRVYLFDADLCLSQDAQPDPVAPRAYNRLQTVTESRKPARRSARPRVRQAGKGGRS